MLLLFSVVPLVLIWGGVSAYNLARGLQSGTMRCVYGYAPAPAILEDRPARFWTYAIVNSVMVAISAAVLAAIWLGATAA